MGFKNIDKFLESRKKSSYELIEVMQDIQENYGYLPEDVLKTISEKLEAPLIEVFRVANFYKAFTLKPRCDACIDFCPMTITPCPGPMKKGEEVLCGLCESQLSMAQEFPGSCVDCRLGEGFNCINSSKKGE
jgi:NADH:ubiquinone oxidoreductase subunit E